MRYFIKLSYNGKGYHGWQKQPNALTVQEDIEKGLGLLLKSKIEIVGAGRTDAGVHAKVMFAHFDFDNEIDCNQLAFKLNALLGKGIAIQEIRPVHEDAHTRFDATSRTYNYKISLQKDVFNTELSYRLKQNLDVDIMNEACRILIGRQDFQCFSKSHTDVTNYFCNITEAFWIKNEDQLVFVISANRFLRNMVRAIVGTLINIGVGKISINDLKSIINSKNRSQAGYSVPAHGLYLVAINYPYI